MNIIKTTATALQVLCERLLEAVDQDNESALKEALLIEVGAHLVARALAFDLDVTAERLTDLRAEVMRKIDGAADMTDAEFAAIDSFLNQRKKADLN